MFVDQVNIIVRSGDGGDGCSSFLREKFIPLGGPDGGDGGKGGDIILETDPSLQTLFDLRYQKINKAEDGRPGRGKQMTGRSGKSCVLKVPLGTLVKDEVSGELLVDLKNKDQQFIAAVGGRGGSGNARYKTSSNRAPRKFQTGFPGEKMRLVLELKLLADVGIIGFPNAGKSTLIAKISNARPKIADYPFSTLIPNLGIVKMDDFSSFVAADIPGLIEGAHEGKGLGIQFLKHTERTRLLVHLIDFSIASDRDPLDDYKAIQKELKSYSQTLYEKPQILVPSKIDHPEAEEKLKQFEAELKKLNPNFLPISAVTGSGVPELLRQIQDQLNTLKNSSE
jgi:GTP-binding protein